MQKYVNFLLFVEAHLVEALQVVSSIRDALIGYFLLHYPFATTLVLGSTKPPTKISIRYISCG
jgi:hypothetical protein